MLDGTAARTIHWAIGRLGDWATRRLGDSAARRLGGSAARRLGGDVPGERAARGEQNEKRGVCYRPDQRLLREGRLALEEERIGKQRDGAAEVAGDVQRIGIAVAAGFRSCEPVLEERRSGGEQHKRRPDSSHEEPEKIGNRRRHVRGCPAGGNSRGKAQRGRYNGTEMNHNLRPPGRARPEPMRVEIAGEQRHLEKQHATRPHSRAAAKMGKGHLGEHWLEQEQQKRVDEDRRGEGIHFVSWVAESPSR